MFLAAILPIFNAVLAVALPTSPLHVLGLSRTTTGPAPAPTRTTVAITVTSTATTTVAHPPPKATYTGKATWTYVSVGACGFNSTDDQLVVGISEKLLVAHEAPGDHNPNHSLICKQNITATYGSHTVVAQIVDSCASCDEFDLNFSRAAFQKLENLNVGVIKGVKWHRSP